MDIPFLIREEQEQIRAPRKDEVILFLDFDGVVHKVPNDLIPSSWLQIIFEKNKRFFMDDQMLLVQKLCERLNGVIVLSTSWRHEDFGLERYNAIFNGLIIGQTPHVERNPGESGIREREIKKYLLDNNLSNRYVILDDKAQNFSGSVENLFLTDSNIGLTEEIVHRILADF